MMVDISTNINKTNYLSPQTMAHKKILWHVALKIHVVVNIVIPCYYAND